jgi:nuclear fragile X mental retardation-interacting protein 1
MTETSNGNPLISLLGEYHSTESDSDSPPDETAVSRAVSGPLPPPIAEVKKAAPSIAAPLRPVREQRNPREQFKKRNRPPTLLQKLLEPEIRRERNILLQCVHYVVQKKFFQ